VDDILDEGFVAADAAIEYVLADILVELRRISAKLDVLTELAPVIHKLTTSPLGRLLK
jgi:hypothetical protein